MLTITQVVTADIDESMKSDPTVLRNRATSCRTRQLHNALATNETRIRPRVGVKYIRPSQRCPLKRKLKIFILHVVTEQKSTEIQYNVPYECYQQNVYYLSLIVRYLIYPAFYFI